MLYQLRKLRPLISTGPEYRLRRMLCHVIPSEAPQVDALFHACTWKTGSQWVRLILSDPRFYRATGLRPFHGPRLLETTGPTGQTVVPSRSVTASLMIDFEAFNSLQKPDNWKAFFVVRDPRDLLVSRYHSARFSHRVIGNLAELRKTMEQMTDEEGILYTIDNRFENIANIIRSWIDASENESFRDRIQIVKFEDLTSDRNAQVWHDLMTSLDVSISDKTIDGLLRFYHGSKLKPKGSSKAKKTEKYRSGKRGEWKDHFTDAVADRFNERFGSLASEMGYRDE